MRTPRRSGRAVGPLHHRRAGVAAALAALAAVAIALGAASGDAAGPPARPVAEPSVIVLRFPSVAGRVTARVGRGASETEERAWSADAFHAQEGVLARLAALGLAVRPTARFTRTLDGFAARLGAAQVAALERDPAVAGVYPASTVTALPVKAARPGPLPRGVDGAGVSIAAIAAGGGPAALLAARVGMRAPGASVTVVPAGSAAVPARADGVLAALERALDPNGDGDCHDAARVVVTAFGEPGTLFPDAPLARAVEAAAALDTVVVAPAGGGGVAGGTAADGTADGAADLAATVALLAGERPGLGGRTLLALARAAAARPGGAPDLAAALAAELAVELPSAEAVAGTAISVVVRNVSTRPLRPEIAVAAPATALPRALDLPPGAARVVTIRRGLAAPGPARGGQLVATAEGGVTATASWDAVAAPGDPAVLRAELVAPGRAGRAPSDAVPSRLVLDTRDAGPLGRVDVTLWAGRHPLGLLWRLRDVPPGRYVVALTGRGPDGARLVPGLYRIAVSAAAARPAQSGSALLGPPSKILAFPVG